MAYFITDENSTKAGDPNISIINGIHRIKGKTSVNILVSNYTNKHIIFNKVEYIGHLGPAIMDDIKIDDLETHSTHSITLQKKMAEQVQQDVFWSTSSQVKTRHSVKIRYTSEGIWNTICQGWDIHKNHTINRNNHQHWWLWIHITKIISYSNEELPMGKGRNRKTTHSKSHPQQQVKLVSTHNCSPKRRWRKVISHQLQSIKHGY